MKNINFGWITLKGYGNKNNPRGRMQNNFIKTLDCNLRGGLKIKLR